MINNFFQCPLCKLFLGKSLMKTIQVIHQGRLVNVAVCTVCKEKHESQPKGTK